MTDYNVYEEMLSIYSTDDQSLIHTEHIFQTKLRQKKHKKNKIRISLSSLQAFYQIVVYHNLIFVYFHEHKNPIHIMEFVRVLGHLNHKHTNVSNQLLVYR